MAKEEVSVFQQAFNECKMVGTTSIRDYFAHLLALDKSALLEMQGTAATVMAAQCLFMIKNSVLLTESLEMDQHTFNEFSGILRRVGKVPSVKEIERRVS